MRAHKNRSEKSHVNSNYFQTGLSSLRAHVNGPLVVFSVHKILDQRRNNDETTSMQRRRREI